MSELNTQSADTRDSRPQFTLGAIFGMFFALALYFAYLRQIDSAAVLYGCVAVAMGLVVGGASGWVAGHLVDAAYWAALCAALGYIATAGESSLGTAFHLAWAGVGTAAGAGSNLVGRHRFFLRVLLAGLGGALAMGIYLCLIQGTTAENLFDAICAPVVGVLIGVLIQILQWLEADRRLPRYTIATWLLCAVMVGNLAVELFVH